MIILSVIHIFSKVHGTVILLGLRVNIINNMMMLHSVALWRNNVNIITHSSIEMAQNLPLKNNQLTVTVLL